jgi:hypothetical protein
MQQGAMMPEARDSTAVFKDVWPLFRSASACCQTRVSNGTGAFSTMMRTRRALPAKATVLPSRGQLMIRTDDVNHGRSTQLPRKAEHTRIHRLPVFRTAFRE